MALRCRLLLVLALAAAHPASGGERRKVELRTLDPTVLCTTTDNYCKVTMKVAYTYPVKPAPAQLPVPIECTAWVAITRASSDVQTTQAFTSTLRTALNYGTIDEDVEVVLKPPARTTSMQLKSVGCSAELP